MRLSLALITQPYVDEGNGAGAGQRTTSPTAPPQDSPILLPSNENLDNAGFSDKQELIAKLGIMVYPSEDLKTVRITTKLPVLGDELSRYKISMASPKL